MRPISTTTLFSMEVVNLCNGTRLGCISSMEIDADCGQITAVLIPIDNGFLSFGRSDLYRIPWCRIECIGEDAVLVKLTDAELSSCLCKKGKR